jgi:thiamine-monophosphate kinase
LKPPSPSISSIGERGLIDRLRRRLGPTPDFVRIGVGDDAAVLVPARGMQDAITTDSLIEGVHFRRDSTTAKAIGHKALAVNLSDLAAMGATPRAALLSLAMPVDFPLDDFDDLVEGFVSLAERSGTALIGGNMTRSPGPLVVDVTAIGSVRPRRVLERVGARKGDWLYVTGHVGSAAAGLGLLTSGLDRALMSEGQLACVARLETPEPRTRFGRIVARIGAANAAIDLSDGLGDAALRLAEAARLGVVVDAALVPVHGAARDWFVSRNTDPIAAAVAGGEDYELAFAVSPRREKRFLSAARRCPDLLVTRVGLFATEPGAWLDSGGSLTPLCQAFSHF